VKGEYDYRYVSSEYHELIALTLRKIVKARGLKANLYKVVSFDIVNFIATNKPQGVHNLQERRADEFI
jgi:hypothetical protein